MKIKHFFCLFILMSLICSCIPSIHQLYTKETLRFEESLIGSWAEVGSADTTSLSSPDLAGPRGERWQFKKGNGLNYSLTHTDPDGHSADFEIHLVEIAGLRFLDFFPAGDENDNNEWWEYHRWPMHTFAKIAIEPKQVAISMMNHEWIESLIKESKVRIKHEKVGDEIVITAPTRELQKFMAKYGNEEKAFLDPIILHRSNQ